MPSEATKTKALAALDGMREVVRAEMVVQGFYMDDEVTNPRRINSVCGGRLHCAIGSLWAGAGIKAKRDEWDDALFLPGVEQSQRDDFLRHRPGLRLAYDSLNDAAATFIEQHGIEREHTFSAPIEDLFEGHYGDELTKRDLLGIIASAKRRVRNA